MSVARRDGRSQVRSFMKKRQRAKAVVNCTLFVRQYDILYNKWGAVHYYMNLHFRYRKIAFYTFRHSGLGGVYPSSFRNILLSSATQKPSPLQNEKKSARWLASCQRSHIATMQCGFFDRPKGRRARAFSTR